MSFKQSLAAGQVGESLIARWYRRKGDHVLPVYDIAEGNYKGPRLFMPATAHVQQLIAPDMLVIGDGKIQWIEAKTKSHFSWYHKHRYFTTGIDFRHYKDYCAVEAATGLPVWLLFLHTDRRTDPDEVRRYAAPPTCPTGLFGNQVGVLQTMQPDHVSNQYGSGGMIYWRVDQLIRLATLEEVYGQDKCQGNVAYALVTQN